MESGDGEIVLGAGAPQGAILAACSNSEAAVSGKAHLQHYS
jgi:hypothetical protein